MKTRTNTPKTLQGKSKQFQKKRGLKTPKTIKNGRDDYIFDNNS